MSIPGQISLWPSIKEHPYYIKVDDAFYIAQYIPPRPLTTDPESSWLPQKFSIRKETISGFVMEEDFRVSLKGLINTMKQIASLKKWQPVPTD